MRLFCGFLGDFLPRYKYLHEAFLWVFWGDFCLDGVGDTFGLGGFL